MDMDNGKRDLWAALCDISFNGEITLKRGNLYYWLDVHNNRRCLKTTL